MARPKKVVNGNDLRSLVSKYNKGAGLVALAEEFGVSIPVIRRALVDGGVTVRGRGRPVGSVAAE